MSSNQEDPKIPKPFEPHPGFRDEINRNFIESEIEGGIYLDNMPVGHFLEIETQNRIYTIERREDGFYISGHPEFCPEPVKVEIRGSTWGGSIIKAGFIGRGMHLEFTHPEFKTVTTSIIKEIKEFEGKPK